MAVSRSSVEAPSSSSLTRRGNEDACVEALPAGGRVALTVPEEADEAGDGASAIPARQEVSGAGQATLRQEAGGRALPAAAPSEAGDEAAVTHGEKVVVGDQTGVAAEGGKAKVKKAPSLTPLPSPPRSAGLVLASVGRDLGFEAALVERLGRLVCEGALIEVVDVHKEVCGCVCPGCVENLVIAQRIVRPSHSCSSRMQQLLLLHPPRVLRP